MKRTFTLILTCLLLKFNSFAQTPVQAFGKVDIADLELKQCDFEKDANAMVLFDKGDVYFDSDFNIVMERHKRIKIFNDKGKDEANIRIVYYGANRLESMTDVQVETINETNGKPEITKLERKLIYTENIDKIRTALVFAFPNVKPGSVIEFKYRWQTTSYSLPDWFFQSKIPTRYTELDTEIPEYFYYRPQMRIHQAFSKYTTSGESKTMGTGTNPTSYTTEKIVRGLANVPSLADEPYMSSRMDNLESIMFQLTTIKPINGFVKNYSDTWAKVGGILADDEDFGSQLNRKLKTEEIIIAKAKLLKTDDEKIAFVFNEVKNKMKWNGDDIWYTNNGTVQAWEKQTGNSSEINLILFHLLKKSGVKVYPMVVSTREHGKVNDAYPFLYQFNRAVAYIPVDSTKHYILDATSKYNVYNETPDELLNSYGLYISKDEKIFDLLFITKEQPVRQTIMITADITADGKMNGTAQISSVSYDKINTVKQYKTDGEEKYKLYLTSSDNNLNINALKLENMEVDSLPLTQSFSFKLTLAGSDGDYIYFKPDMFTSLKNNPFLSENRTTDIDFGYLNSYSINGVYKIPTGYKTDALPKNLTLVMPDQSISFRRIVVEDNGSIAVRYLINFKKVMYFKENYAEFREFYKKMHEMLDEQIVLKKS
jgi:hypothetical protein